MILKKIR